MTMSRLALCAFCAVLCCSLASAQNLKKTPLYPDSAGGLSTATPLGSILPRQSFQLTPNAPTASCTAPGLGDECQELGHQYSAFTAIYNDSPNQVSICICQGAAFDAPGLAKSFALVPLFLRQNVKSVAAVPIASGSSKNGAYTAGGHIVVFADVGDDVFVHESTHAQDGNVGFSGSAAYHQAVTADTCVPDDYANTNFVECYAQDMVVFLYKLWTGSTPAPGTGCMAKQLATLQNSQAPLVQQYQTAVQKLPGEQVPLDSVCLQPSFSCTPDSVRPSSRSTICISQAAKLAMHISKMLSEGSSLSDSAGSAVAIREHCKRATHRKLLQKRTPIYDLSSLRSSSTSLHAHDDEAALSS